MTEIARVLEGPVSMTHLLTKLAALITRGLEIVAGTLMLALAILVLANAIGRYAFSQSLPWSEDIVRNILVWIVASGVVLAGLRQGLICCDILVGRIHTRVHGVLAGVCGVGGAVVLFYCAYLTWQYMMIFGGDRSLILGIPKWVMIGGIFFALAGLGCTMLAPVLRRRAG